MGDKAARRDPWWLSAWDRPPWWHLTPSHCLTPAPLTLNAFHPPRVQFLCNALGIHFRRRGSGELYSGPGPVIFLVGDKEAHLCIVQNFT
jgi:hypothetical protein